MQTSGWGAVHGYSFHLYPSRICMAPASPTWLHLHSLLPFALTRSLSIPVTFCLRTSAFAVPSPGRSFTQTPSEQAPSPDWSLYSNNSFSEKSSMRTRFKSPSLTPALFFPIELMTSDTLCFVYLLAISTDTMLASRANYLFVCSLLYHQLSDGYTHSRHQRNTHWTNQLCFCSGSKRKPHTQHISTHVNEIMVTSHL